jgi:hypothetical protein
MLYGLRRSHGCRPLTLGADKGYDDGAFLVDVRKRAITPPLVMEGAIRDGEIEPKCERSLARWLWRLGATGRTSTRAGGNGSWSRRRSAG